LDADKFPVTFGDCADESGQIDDELVCAKVADDRQVKKTR
jgi:hypothetical protein